MDFLRCINHLGADVLKVCVVSPVDTGKTPGSAVELTCLAERIAGTVGDQSILIES